MSAPPKPRLFGPLPRDGPWTALGLPRGPFAAILFGSIALFVFAGGPLWAHLHDGHLRRILISYGAIPVAAAAALARHGTLTWGHLLGATVVLGLLKLLATAVLLAVMALAV
jgi:hypothetical protein